MTRQVMQLRWSMRAMPRCILLSCLLIFLTAAPRAASQAVPAESGNAADLYRVAWERHAELLDAFNAELQRTRVGIVDQKWDVPEKRTTRLLQDCGPLIEDLIRASHKSDADWGIDPDDPFVTLPHLLKLRTSARLLAADARVRMVLGETDEAAERIAALFRMSLQLRSDRVAVSVLTATHVVEYAARMAELFIGKARAAPENVAIIRASIGEIAGGDPFEMLDAIEGHRRLLEHEVSVWVEFYATEIRLPPMLDGSLRVAEGFIMMGQFDRLDAMYQSIIEARISEDAADRLDEIRAKIEAGYYGRFAHDFSSMVFSAFRADLLAQARIAEVRALLDEHGAGGR